MSFPRVAVIGAGGLSGKQIYPNLAEAGLKLVAACDLELDKAKARCEQYGGDAYDDVDTMLTEAEIDGVIICVGPEFHCAGALKMLKAGLPVYTEKPPAVCAADLLPVVELAREKNLIAMTAMKKRYAEVYRRAKAFIDSPEFGQPQHLHMYRVSHVKWKNVNPRTDHLLDYGVHNIDVVAWLFGDVTSVRAAAVGKQVYQVELRFANGAIGAISFVERPGCTPHETLELTGTEGWMSTEHQSAYRIGHGKQILEVKDPNFSTAGGDGGAMTGHRTELEAFAAALRDGTRPVSHIEESYRSMQIYDTIVRAVESGQEERVPARLAEPASA